MYNLRMIKNIILKLIALGLTQTEISKRSGVPQSRLSEIINDKQITLSYESGKKLEDLLSEFEIVKVA